MRMLEFGGFDFGRVSLTLKWQPCQLFEEFESFHVDQLSTFESYWYVDREEIYRIELMRWWAVANCRWRRRPEDLNLSIKVLFGACYVERVSV